jgi:GT2 family glycosyltransferase
MTDVTDSSVSTSDGPACEQAATVPPEKIVTVLSVIIVSYNTRELTLQCLSALATELHALGIPSEVIVVDNGSTDGTVPAVREKFTDVVVIDAGRNLGFGAANNRAMELATGEFFLLLNTDAFLRSGAISTLLHFLEAHPRMAVAGPRLLNVDGSLQMSCYKFPSPGRAWCEHTLLTAAFPNHRFVGDFRAWAHDREREVDFVIGACMLVRRSAVKEVGQFDERFFMYSEETDWCRRFKDAGWTVGFTPVAEVVHLNGGSGKRQAAQVFNEFRRSAERYIHKHHGRVGLAVFRLCLIGGSCWRIILFSARSLFPGKGRSTAAVRVREWMRILFWNLGLRGPGLSQ